MDLCTQDIQLTQGECVLLNAEVVLLGNYAENADLTLSESDGGVHIPFFLLWLSMQFNASPHLEELLGANF